MWWTARWELARLKEAWTGRGASITCSSIADSICCRRVSRAIAHFPTVSFHLGLDICTIDLRGTEPTAEILERAARSANEIVYEDRPVNVKYGTAGSWPPRECVKLWNAPGCCGPSKLKIWSCSHAAGRMCGAPGRSA